MMAAGGGRRVPQAKVDKLVISFICDGLHPFSVVEQPAFNDLIVTLNLQCHVISRPTLRTRIEEAANQMKKNLMSHLSKVSYVGTTTDCWTAHQQSFLGITVHWIDEETLERQSAALACKRLKGSHTFDVLAAAIDDIHCQYKIRGKVVRTTTDSGSNFIKAFTVFGEHSQDLRSQNPTKIHLKNLTPTTWWTHSRFCKKTTALSSNFLHTKGVHAIC